MCVTMSLYSLMNPVTLDFGLVDDQPRGSGLWVGNQLTCFLFVDAMNPSWT